MIEVKGLSKAYGDNVAIKDVSFKAEKGEVVGLIGRNGAGKSTTMNIISGYISPDEGEVTINGHDILKEPVKAKAHLGYMPEFPPLYLDMTVEEYLVFTSRLMKVPEKEIEGEISKICEKVGLTHMRKRLIGNLSKGYKQRVGIAKALCGDPENIILDEPTSGLDPYQIIEIREMIRELGTNHAIILSSHILPELADICTRLVIIDRGVIAADDTLDNMTKLYDDGTTLQVNVQEDFDRNKLLSVEGVVSVRKQASLEEVFLKVTNAAFSGGASGVQDEGSKADVQTGTQSAAQADDGKGGAEA